MPNLGFKHSEETKAKMSLAHMGKPYYGGAHPMSPKTKAAIIAAHLGKPLSEETKAKLSAAHSGKNHFNWGKHLSEETRRKISNSNKGKRHSPETIKRISEKNKGRKRTPEARAKMSAAKRGENNPMYGTHMSEEHKAKLLAINLGRKKSLDTRVKLSNARKGKPPSAACVEAAAIANRGKPKSLETRKKLSIARATQIITKETCRKISEANCGENNGRWLGGISFEPYCPKFNQDLRHRVRAFFEFRCVLCGKTTEENGRALHCHHVEYNKNACCDGKPVHFAALCGRCHIKTNIDRERWEAMLHRAIDEIWNGRSYYTKEEMSKRIMEAEG